MTIEPDAPPIDNLAVPATDEPGIIPGSPESMPSEDLARLVRDGVKKFSNLIPYVKELRQRFAALPRGNAGIMGCKTWTEFCENILGRTDSAVRKALAEKSTVKAGRKTLMHSLKSILPVADEDTPNAHFSFSENGILGLSADSKKGGKIETQLDAIYVDPPGKAIFTDEATGEELTLDVKIVRQSPEFIMNMEYLLPCLKPMNGDPTIIFRGFDRVVEFQEGDGLLRLINLSIKGPAPALRIEKYPGEFLPAIDGAIVLMTSEDRQRSDEWWRAQQAEEEGRQQQLEEEKLQRAAEKDVRDAANAAKAQRVRELINRLPRNIEFLESWVLYETGLHLNVCRITIEQLERIVEALQPAPELAGGISWKEQRG